MKALILRGKYTGKEVEISQWCNDWFTLDPEKNKDLTEAQKRDIIRSPFNPTSLAFDHATFQVIREHKNNGQLFVEFEPREMKGVFGSYEWSFQRKKAVEPERIYLTKAQAKGLIAELSPGYTHIFNNIGGILAGFDMPIRVIQEKIAEADQIEIGGEQCMAMGHALVITPKGAQKHGELWFVQHDKKKIQKYLK